MRTIMARTPHESSFNSFSRRHFQWRKKSDGDDDDDKLHGDGNGNGNATAENEQQEEKGRSFAKMRQPAVVAVARLRSVLANLSKRGRLLHLSSPNGHGTRVIGTLFGYRRGHVHFAFQEDSKSSPAFLIELATPTNGLVREMATGLVRIALECDKKVEKKGVKLLEESVWRTYCNGKKCGYGMRRECGVEELKVLKAVEPISMGAGVLPGNGGEAGELMYMRAKFERIVGSRDSEAFYMMNPDGTGGPELSIYLLRV